MPALVYPIRGGVPDLPVSVGDVGALGPLDKLSVAGTQVAQHQNQRPQIDGVT